MKKVFCFFLFCIYFFISCKKDKDVESKASVIIDRHQIVGLDHILIQASIQQVIQNQIIEKGFCWSTSPNPTVKNRTLTVNKDREFIDTLKSIGQDSSFFIRAWIKTSTGLTYSDQITVSTGGLKVSWDKSFNNGRPRTIKRVIRSDHNSFIIFLQAFKSNYENEVAAELIEIDTTGVVKWDTEYSMGLYKDPVEITKVKDGYVFVSKTWVEGGITMFVTKVNFSGQPIWEKSYSRNAFQEFVRLNTLASGDVKLNITSFDGIAQDGFRENFKIHEFVIAANGDLVSHDVFDYESKYWETTNITSTGKSTEDGEYISTNLISISSGDEYLTRYLLQRFDERFKIKWERTLDNLGFCVAIDVSAGTDNNPVVVNWRHIPNKTWISEFNKHDGTLLWDMTYENKYYANGHTQGVNICSIGENHYITGMVSPSVGGSENAFICKVNEHEKFLWDYTFENPPNIWYNKPGAIIVDTDKNIYMFGSRLTDLSAPAEIYITKLRETR